MVPDKCLIKEPWLTKGLLNCIKKRKTLYKTYISSKTGISENKYKVYRNTLQRILRIAKREYFTEQSMTFKNKTKKLWHIINSITRKTYDKSCLIESLKVQNLEYHDGKDITAEFGKYFSTVGQSFANKIKPCKIPIGKYLSKIEINKNSVFLSPCDKTELNKLISKLPIKRALDMIMCQMFY